MSDMSINARHVTKRITLKVKGLPLMKLRGRVAAEVFKLGALIAGTQIEIEDS